MSDSFLRFLCDCPSIRSIIDEFGSNYPQETEGTITYDLTSFKQWDEEIVQEILEESHLWQRETGYHILLYLASFEFNLNLLRNVVIDNDWKLDIDALANMVRMLDILGSYRLREYEIITYFTMAHLGIPKHSALPVSFYKHRHQEIAKLSLTENICKIGSQRLIEYIKSEYCHPNIAIQFQHQRAFGWLCEYGHLELAQQYYEHTPNIDLHYDNDNAFLKACLYGHLHVIQWLYSLGDMNVSIYGFAPFVGAGEHGHWEVLHWLYTHTTTIPKTLYFELACNGGQLELAQTLYATGEIDLQAQNDIHFLEICRNGHYEVARWRYNLSVSLNKTTPQSRVIDIHNRQDKAFCIACKSGNFQLVQWIYSLGYVNIHSQYDLAFRNACQGGHLEIAQWLYALDGKVDIHVKNDEACRLIALTGNLTMIQWLVSLGDVDITIPFRSSCSSGQLEIAQWIYAVKDSELELSRSFQMACFHGHLDVAQWLFSLQPTLPLNHAFQCACANGNDEIVEWLYGLSHDDGGSILDIHDDDDMAFRRAAYEGHIHIVQWLYQLGGIDIQKLEKYLDFTNLSCLIQQWFELLYQAST